MSRALCQSVTKTSCSGSVVSTVARSRVEKCIAEYLHEINPGARLFPTDQAQRAHCRSICGEMHSGFSNLRSALPMNIKARFVGFKAWAGARADIDGLS